MRQDIIQEILHYAAHNDMLRLTPNHRTVIYCNGFESRIQILNELDSDIDCVLMLDVNRQKDDELGGMGPTRHEDFMLYFCCKEHEWTDTDLLDQALQRCEDLMDDFTAYLCTKAKKARSSMNTASPFFLFDTEQSFGATTTGPFDGGWCTYQMRLTWDYDIGCHRVWNRSHWVD